MERNKRILIFTTAYLPHIGGAEIAIKEITDRLPDYDFDLITARLDRRLPKEEKIGRVRVYRLGWGCFLDKYYLAFCGHFKAIKLHKDNPYNLIWGMIASWGGLSAVKFKKKTNLPFLLSLQEGDDLKKIEAKAKILGSWWKDIFKQADQIQAISTYLADWAYSLGFKGRVEVIPNGVDLGLFKFRNKPIDWNNKPREIKLVTTSRLVYKNGLDLVITALPYLSTNISFHIAGVGKEKRKLQILAGKLGVIERVIFYDLIPYTQLPDFLIQGDIFIRLSRTEGLGNSFLEAMACGLPVIGTNVGGIPDFLTDQKTGFVIPVDKPQAVAKKIKYIIDSINIEEVKDIIGQGKKLIENNYNWDIIFQKMDKIFLDLT